MATISIEFGKESSPKTREVYLLVRQGKTRQRVKTGVRLNEQEYFSIINDNNFKLLDMVFNLTKSKRGRKPKKQEVA